jgi:hypothetical protein
MTLSDSYRRAIFQSPHTVWVTCLSVVLVNGAFYFTTDILNADLQSMRIDTQMQLIGMLLLFTLLPMWLLACFIVTQRHSLNLARQLDPLLPHKARIADDITRFPRREVSIGLIGGLVWALAFNIPSEQFNAVRTGNGAVIAVIYGQILVWVCVGLVLAIRLHAVNLFHRGGQVVELSIFEPTRLEPFARVGMLDVVIVVVGMAVASVQSLDAEFRLENYLTAILVAVPAGAALLIRPMWALHLRLAERKAQLLEEVSAEIHSAPEDSSHNSMQQLELLLQRRARIKALHTWPLDIAIWSRLFFYGLIPPLAWAGSAIMEVIVSRFLGA